MTAYYNEIDPYAAQWLRNLIAAGHIAPGDVDERSIEDVRPDDLKGYVQCHFFAGVGVWSHALRLAGWSDDRHVWTGSCPCQPFSQAGKGGGFDDERHLWPAWFWLIRQCKPSKIFGEQSSSADALRWFDVVQADLESENYTIGVADMCAAGCGAPHIRQRLWFHANRLADANNQRLERRAVSTECADQQSAGSSGLVSGLGNAALVPLGTLDRQSKQSVEQQKQAGRSGVFGVRMDNAVSVGWTTGGGGDGEYVRQFTDATGQYGRSYWSGAEWIPCADGKARPVEPGTFPLAHGSTARVGRLRAYGNAIVAPVAATFIKAAMEITS